MSSEQLADYFSRLTVSGTSKICLLIGGSCGLSERVKQKAALRLSMSPMPGRFRIISRGSWCSNRSIARSISPQAASITSEKRDSMTKEQIAAIAVVLSARRSLFCAAVPSSAGTAERAAKAEAAAKDRQKMLPDVRR